MSNTHHAIYLTVIVGLSLVIFGLLTPRSIEQSEQIGKHQLVVFPFRPRDVDSEAIAVTLTSALTQTLEQVPNIEVVRVSDLPSNMRNPGDHHSWASGGIVSLFVEGSVQTNSEGIQVTAQLVDTSSNGHVWSNSYVSDRDNTSEIVAAVEDQVVLIANK